MIGVCFDTDGDKAVIIGYARVSTDEQSTAVQVEQLEARGCQRIYDENASGKSRSGRSQLELALEMCREGDTFMVTKVDRIARNTADALKIADELKDKGAGFVCLDLGDGIDINSSVGRAMYTVISAFATMERERILKRCQEGRARAKEEGKHLGRRKDEKLHDRIKQLAADGMAKAAIARELGIGRSTVIRSLKSE